MKSVRCQAIVWYPNQKLKSLEHFFEGLWQETLFLKVKKLSAKKFLAARETVWHRGSS